MKKLFLGSIALTMFSISIIIFQLSCKKEAQAQGGSSNYTLPSATMTTLGGIIVGNGLTISNTGILSTNSSIQQAGRILFTRKTVALNITEIWSANYDGTGQSKINITIPANNLINNFGVKLSPDGQKIFFQMTNTLTNVTSIYTCKIDGTNSTKIVDGSNLTSEGLTMEVAF